MFRGGCESRTILLSLTLCLCLYSVAATAITDPTRPAQYRPAVSKASLSLESILYSDTRRVAVINGRVLTEGETIGSAKVLHIGKDTVRLRRDGSTVRLTLQRPTIRQEK